MNHSVGNNILTPSMVSRDMIRMFVGCPIDMARVYNRHRTRAELILNRLAELGEIVNPKRKARMAKGTRKIAKVIGEFDRGTLHSGSKKGPKVTGLAQARAIALSEARAAGAKIPKRKGK
jgi:hypothetical protein